MKTAQFIFRSVFAAILLLPAGLAHADEKDDYRRMIEQQKKQQEQYIKRLELIPGGKKKIEDLIAVSVKDSKLTLESPLFTSENLAKLKNRQWRAEVDGFGGLCTLMVQPIGNDGYYFTFSNAQYPDLEGVSTLTVTMQPNYLSIAKNSNARLKNYNVNLVQITGDGRVRFGQPEGVQLNVYGGDNMGRSTVSINLNEPDFTTLRRKHPKEITEHLRPLLREFKLESLFAVEPTVAWQVFSADWKGNEAVSQKIKAALPALDADAYKERDAAQHDISKLGPDAALVIYKMQRDGLTEEQNSRLDTVLSAFSFLPVSEADRLRNDVDFLLDCLYCENADIRELAFKQLQTLAKHELTFDTKAQYAIRATQIEALRSELVRRPATQPATAPAPATR